MWGIFRQSNQIQSVVVSFSCMFAIYGAPAFSAEIANWNFENGTANDSVGGFDLSSIGGGPVISGGIALFDGDEGAPSYLETPGFGASADWTVSILLQVTGGFDQGNFQGILSNNNSSTANFSWQLESFGGIYQFRTTSGVHVIGAPTGVWDRIVVRKIGGADGDIWYNGVQVVSSIGSNPGGLQNFRLGTNRNSNNFYAFGVDDLRVFNSVENPLVVPQSASVILLGLGLIGLGAGSGRRRAHEVIRFRANG